MDAAQAPERRSPTLRDSRPRVHEKRWPVELFCALNEREFLALKMRAAEAHGLPDYRAADLVHVNSYVRSLIGEDVRDVVAELEQRAKRAEVRP